MLGGRTDERMDGQAEPKTAELIRTEPNRTEPRPRHPGAYRRLWAAPTRSGEQERDRQRRGGEEMGGREEGEGFTQPSPEQKSTSRNTPSVDAPISHVEPSVRALSVSFPLNVRRKREGGKRERASSFCIAVLLRGKETTTKLTSSVLPRR